MQTIPLTDVPSQTLYVVLAGQSCRIDVYLRATGLYVDLYRDDVVLVAGSLCVNGVRIVRDAYLGFTGDLTFIDVQGVEAPTSPGLGTRFLLVYLEAADLAAMGVS